MSAATQLREPCACQQPSQLWLSHVELDGDHFNWRLRLTDPRLDEPVYLYIRTCRAGWAISYVGWDEHSDCVPGCGAAEEEPASKGWPLDDPDLVEVVLERIDEELTRAFLARSLPPLRNPLRRAA